MLGEERLHSVIESLLLISAEPVPPGRIIEVIRIEDPQTEEETIKEAIQSLLGKYQEARTVGRGFRVEEVAGGLQLRTVAENAQYVRRFLAAKPQRLSKAALETLSIIAYRQPVTKPEVEAIRGVDVGAALKGLLERELIKILGKREEVGRPIIYGTTPYFLEFFGLKSLAELPTLREYHELDEEHQKEVEALGGEDKPNIADLAAAASFLVDRDDDPDLDALDKAVQDADRLRRSTDEALDGPKEPEEAAAGEAPADPSPAEEKPAAKEPVAQEPVDGAPAEKASAEEVPPAAEP